DDDDVQIITLYSEEMGHPDKEMLLDVLQITPEHVRSNGTVHTTPHAGIAELIDNAVDSNATNVKITYNKKNGYIIVTDDGCGMNRIDALRTLLVGHSNKRGDNECIGQFGNGLKSGAMRLGETLLVVTKQKSEWTVLMISLAYLDSLGCKQCYVPCISYDHQPNSQNWDIHRMRGENKAKHDRALKVILEYSPFKTEKALFEHMLASITTNTGTSVLVTDLKRMENGQYEITTRNGDIVLNNRVTYEGAPGAKKRKSSTDDDDDPRERNLSKYLQDLYLDPKVVIFINDLKVQVRDPIRSLADPQWMQLAKNGIEQFVQRHTTNLVKEKKRVTNLILKREEEQNRLQREYSKEPEAIKMKQIKRDLAALGSELAELRKSFAHLSNDTVKAGSDIKVYFGVNIEKRCDSYVVFYTNGRRIMQVPFKRPESKFHKTMGVVAIVNIPSTLMPTSQNRENYEVPQEVKFIVDKIYKLAEVYFTYADSKFKSDKFWLEFGYDKEGLHYDQADMNIPGIEAKILNTVGYRKQCDACAQFKLVAAQPDEIFDSLEPEPYFRCQEVLDFKDGNAPQLMCVKKTEAELSAEEIPEVIQNRSNATYYAPLKAMGKNQTESKNADDEKGSNSKSRAAVAMDFVKLMAQANEHSQSPENDRTVRRTRGAPSQAELRTEKPSTSSARQSSNSRPSPTKKPQRRKMQSSSSSEEESSDDARPSPAKRKTTKNGNGMVLWKDEGETGRRRKEPVSSMDIAAKSSGRSETRRRTVREESDEEEEEQAEDAKALRRQFNWILRDLGRKLKRARNDEDKLTIVKALIKLEQAEDSYEYLAKYLKTIPK
ncbi:hypothetical protein PMAYCL1PPCAC_31141, partial [Pristionchus mayeri]